MKRLSKYSSWRQIMALYDIIEDLQDPWGRKGFFEIRTGKWLSNYSCHIDFHEEMSGTSWKTRNIVNSYTDQLDRKENMIEAINRFIDWHNKAPKKKL